MNDEATVTVTNIVATVVVENLETATTATVEAAGQATIVISKVGVQGPPGPSGGLDDGFIIDGGNF